MTSTQYERPNAGIVNRNFFDLAMTDLDAADDAEDYRMRVLAREMQD